MVARGLVGRIFIAGALGLTAMAPAASQSPPGFVPVTDAMIQHPDPKDWLSWRRTLDSWGYSPLNEINTKNVTQLRMVWARPLNDGSQEGTPLVHDGIIYFPAPGDVIDAIDAKSGVVLWEHRRKLPADIGKFLPVWSTNRNLAIYGDLIIANGADDYLYALDAKTGKQVWETKILPYNHGAKQSAGPIIADGLAITGRSCEPEGGPDACVIVANDAKTGKEVWRTSTIARGDDPNNATWGDVPLNHRIQVGAWMVASYDPQLKLVYMGTSVSAPAPKFLLAGNDKTYLYHNSTLALDVKTGKIVWYYQHIVDHWDLDHPFPRMLMDEQVAPDPKSVAWINPHIKRGKVYKVLTGVPGKTGIVYTLDRTNGEFLWARPTVFQNVVQKIDGATGKVTVNPDTTFDKVGETKEVCPSATGGANYQAPAYSPLTKTMYFPEQNTCAKVTPVEPKWGDNLTYSFASRQFLSPGANNNVGSIHAVNAVTGKDEWTREQRAGMQSLLTTGGGLLFAGDAAGRFRALDQRTGKVLWEMNLGSSVTGYPITFAVDGHQYVAVSTGRWLNDTFTPELIHGAQNTLFVFALPQAGIGARGLVKAPINPSVFTTNDPNQQAQVKTSRSVADGVFGTAQAAMGKAVYEAHCAVCHGADFQPSGGVPPVKGEAFLANWKGHTVDELFAKVRTMPPGAAGSLSDADYLAAVAYLLQANGYPPGQDLSEDEALLNDIGFGQ